MTNGWKITAIIFIILFLVGTTLFVWGVIDINKDANRELECYYNVCDVDNEESEYYYYQYSELENLCTCYGLYEGQVLEVYLD